jgi:hypothetical protein
MRKIWRDCFEKFIWDCPLSSAEVSLLSEQTSLFPIQDIRVFLKFLLQLSLYSFEHRFVYKEILIVKILLSALSRNGTIEDGRWGQGKGRGGYFDYKIVLAVVHAEDELLHSRIAKRQNWGWGRNHLTRMPGC